MFLRKEALEIGYDDRMIALLVRAGDWHRVRRGAFTFRDVWDAADPRERHRITTRAALRAAKSDAVASHVSSIVEHTETVWDLDLSEVHLTRLDRRAGRREAGVCQHRGKVSKGDVVEINGIRATSVVRAALELTTVTDVEHSLVVVNGLLHDELCTIKDLAARYTTMDPWPNTLATDLVLKLADPRIESVGESRSFYLMWRHAVPYPEPQYKVYDEFGILCARLDFAWPEYGVWLEFDGKEKYVKYLRPGETPGDAVFREKKREEMIRRITGWRCIRITWADLQTPETTARRIMQELHRQAA